MVQFCFTFFQADPGKQSGNHLGSAGTASWSFSHVMTGEGSPSIRHSNLAMPFSSTVCDSGCWKKRDNAGERRREGKLITLCFCWEIQTCYVAQVKRKALLSWKVIPHFPMPYRASAVLTTATERFQCANLLLASFSALRQQCERKDRQLASSSSCLPKLLPCLFTCSIWEGHVEWEKEEGKCHNLERREFPPCLVALPQPQEIKTRQKEQSQMSSYLHKTTAHRLAMLETRVRDPKSFDPSP